MEALPRLGSHFPFPLPGGPNRSSHLSDHHGPFTRPRHSFQLPSGGWGLVLLLESSFVFIYPRLIAITYRNICILLSEIWISTTSHIIFLASYNYYYYVQIRSWCSACRFCPRINGKTARTSGEPACSRWRGYKRPSTRRSRCFFF